jgi:hypothetical protein
MMGEFTRGQIFGGSQLRKSQEEDFYLECIRNLLVGLQIQQIDLFMSKLTPENCYKLGMTYNLAVKQKLGLIEVDDE